MSAWSIAGEWQVDALGYVQARDFSNVVISSTRFTKTLDQRATPSTGLGGKLELRPPAGEGRTLRLGADLRIARGPDGGRSVQRGVWRAHRDPHRRWAERRISGFYGEADGCSAIWSSPPVLVPTAGA